MYAASTPTVPASVSLGIVLAALLLLAAVVAGLVAGESGPVRSVLFAGVRGAVQLGTVSLLISQIVDHILLAVGFIVLMFVVATRTAGRRITAGSHWWWAGAAIAVGVAPVAAAAIGSGAVPATGLAVIPIVGQLIGGALTATSLSGRRIMDELRSRRGEVDAALALGLTPRAARLEITRTAAGTALLPALDQTRTVGTVTLPGAFVGLMLGGASPVQAGVIQLFVLVGLLAAEAIAILVVLELIATDRIPYPAIPGAA